MKKVLALVLSVLLLFAVFPLNTFAAGSDIVSVTVEPVTLIENDAGWWNDHEIWSDEAEDWIWDEWFEYRSRPQYITVELSNGEIIDGEFWDVLDEIGTDDYDYWSDQSYDNQWGIGEYTATLYLMGYEVDYDVEVIESPVENIIVEDISIVEGTNGWTNEDYFWDEESEEWLWCEWYEYGVEPEYITVELKDGRIVEGYYWEVFEEIGYESYDYYSDQSYENQWDVGTHTATFKFMGFEADFNVIIEESPIVSLEIEDLEIIEGSHSYYSNEGFYNIYNRDLEGVITFRDGSTKSVNDEIEIADDWYYVEVDESCQYEESWEAGNTYEVTASILGVSTTFNVTVTETPVKSIDLKDITLYEGLDSDDGEYYVYPQLSQVLLKDGTKGEIVDEDGLYYDGEDYWVYCNEWDMQYEEAWKPGNTYVVTGYLLGKSDTFKVTIKENPVKELQLLKSPTNTEVLVDSCANLKGAIIRIKYADGTYEDICFDYDFTSAYGRMFTSEKLGITEEISLYNGFEKAGNDYAEVELFGRTCKIPVTVKANTIKKISIREAADKSLIINVKRADNTTYDMKVLDLSWCYVMGIDEYEASILTDKGQFYSFIYADEDSFAIELCDDSDYYVCITDGRNP